MTTLKEAIQGRGIVKGSKVFQKPVSDHYRRFYIGKPKRPTTPADLVRIWLSGDEGFELSQYREWLSLAEEFMAEKKNRYSFKEHKSLLARSFQLWLQERE